MENLDQQPISTVIDGATSDAATAPAETNAQEQQINTEQPVESWTYKAVKTEREKRQFFERRVLELEQERAQWLEQGEQRSKEQFWSDPEKHLMEMQQATIDARRQASEARLISVHGKDLFQKMESALADAMKRNDPDLPILRDECLRSVDPASVLRDWYLSTQEGKDKAGLSFSRSDSFPSNFATERNAGQRSRAPWTGPTSLDDIFDRNA